MENVGSKRIVQSRTRQGILPFSRPVDAFARKVAPQNRRAGKNSRDGSSGTARRPAGLSFEEAKTGTKARLARIMIYALRQGLSESFHLQAVSGSKNLPSSPCWKQENRYPLLSPWRPLYIFQLAKVKTFTRFRPPRALGRRQDFREFPARPRRWRRRRPLRRVRRRPETAPVRSPPAFSGWKRGSRR